ncbi:unnamed protein product [Adineta steineri]|uniref:G-protein coupled receptors family 1 profile domain-containing protein n=1 Tax=Adineta steineri TaxID=433720 RepID=A0A818SF20_9BILA|nr:unnamed protein product [Adineta steineri]CAF3670066.1 unnamed protein product [Adineta steineri]
MGVFGNGMNIFVFSSTRTYRTTPTAFYFTVESIFNTISITVNLIPRIVSFAYGVDLTLISVIWCKLRQAILSISVAIPISCACLTTIDQFFVTSPNASLRRLSKKQLAHRIVFIITVVFILHSIPIYYFFHIAPTVNLCYSNNWVFAVYYTLFIIVIDSAIPILTMATFGYLAYRNIRRTVALAEQHADRQLVKMVLIQVALVVICIAPVGIYNAYSLITYGVVKSLNQQAIEYSTSLLVTRLQSNEPNPIKKIAVHIAEQAKELCDIQSRAPDSIAGASIYMACAAVNER